MKPVETTGTEVEPIWDEFGIDRCDFRRHWNGDLINVFSIVGRKATEAETEHFIKECTRSLARWVIEHRDQFGPEDRFQFIIGWPKAIRATARQTVKTGGTFEDVEKIADGLVQVDMRRGWSTGLFPQDEESEAVASDGQPLPYSVSTADSTAPADAL